MSNGPGRHSRREFLVRAGVLGAAVLLVDDVPLLSSGAGATGLSPSALAPVFDALASDTINGLVAFVLPGPDAYSVAQGVSDAAPGGIGADGTSFMLVALDNFYPVPQEPLRLLVQALATGLNSNLPALPGLPDLPELAGQLDLALSPLLSGETTVPLSLLIALLLNFLATLVNPTALHGDFISPFSRLSFTEKASAFAMLEGEASSLAAMVDGNLPEPLKDSISGLFEFLGGALLEFVAFGSYSEWSGFDAVTRQLTSTPVGWSLSNYLTLAPTRRPVEGWDEFKGYLDNELHAQE